MEVTWGQVGFEVGGMGEVRWPSIGYVWSKQKQWKKGENVCRFLPFQILNMAKNVLKLQNTRFFL